MFKRGGHANNGSNASVFAFNNNTGDANTNYSFRPVVLSSHFDAHLFRDIYRLKVQRGVSSRRTPSDLVSKKFNSFGIDLFLYHNIPDYGISYVYRITRGNDANQMSPEEYKHVVTRNDKPS